MEDHDSSYEDMSNTSGAIINRLMEHLAYNNNCADPRDEMRKLLALLSSNSTTYNTFQNILLDETESNSSVLKSSTGTPNYIQTPEKNEQNHETSEMKLSENDLLEGVSVLNISKESEMIVTLPNSATSRGSSKSNNEFTDVKPRKIINIDEMPVLSPKTDFETLLKRRIENENTKKAFNNIEQEERKIVKRPFLKRGEGMSRFGLNKNNLVIESTNSLPWKKNRMKKKTQKISKEKPVEVPVIKIDNCEKLNTKSLKSKAPNKADVTNVKRNSIERLTIPTSVGKKQQKTWAAILTEDQDNFLKQLKQSSFYRNYSSPAKSCVSECDQSYINVVQQQKETAEQNIFNLLENKVANSSFTTNNSFCNKFINSRSSNDDTPLIIKRFIQNNPDFLYLHPKPLTPTPYNDNSQWADETSSNASSCVTCKQDSQIQSSTPAEKNNTMYSCEKEETAKVDSDMKRNMEEMNARLIETGEILKQRLRELEDEIDEFRKENANLKKVRDDIDAEKQKFYEEKSALEAKFNEDKILSEYYLAEEREKIAKQKQTYDRCIREMRLKLNKTNKNEVDSLKSELEELREDMKLKDAKSTTTTARLRNQIKSLEKENGELKEQIEKLKSENRRIQNINANVGRLSNVKYLAEINRKLSMINTGTSRIDNYEDVRHKTNERHRPRARDKTKNNVQRAKSVPNLAVTSQYAQYFSKRDNKTNSNVHIAPSDEEVSSANSSLSKHAKSNDNLPENINTFEINRYSSSPEIKSNLKRDSSTETIMKMKNKTDIDIEQPLMSKSLDLTKSVRSSLGSEGSSFEMRPTISRTNLNPTEIEHSDGTKEFRFPNGNIKFLSQDGKYSKFMYYNGDIKETFYKEGTIKYYYSETKAYHTTYKDGTEIIQFPDGQLEKRYKDGSIEIHLPNGSIRYTDPKNKQVNEEWRFPDGTVLTVSKDGEQVVRFSNGQIEVHTKDHKRREYPDGTVKLIYKDGTSETRYSSGRIRIKDKHGNLVMDTSACG